jgi:hypothetical protein
MEISVLPRAYRDVMEVITDAGHGLRAKQIAVALDLGDSAAKVEGLRGKLRRLVVRGWLSQNSPGIFALVERGERLGGAGSSSLDSGVRSPSNPPEGEPAHGTLRHGREC